MWVLWSVLGVVVLGAIVFGAMVMLTPSYVGDRTKLDRGFSAVEQGKIDTVTVSSAELAAATCEDGAACWIAVDGVVYDMGIFPSWARGVHHDIHAGADNTEKFVQAGHGKQILQKMPVVGRYTQ